MNRAFGIIVACSLLLLPSSAVAGTWSWHSDIVQKIIEVLQNQETRVKDRSADTSAARETTRTPRHADRDAPRSR